MSKKNNFYKAIAVMVGYIVGVGMFSLPFLVSRAGVFSFVFFLVFLGLVQYVLHLIYANIIIASSEYHRLPGYANLYLGKKGKYLVFGAKIFSSFGALLAYIIITGIFLNEIFGESLGGDEFIYASTLFVLEIIVVYFGVSVLARFEMIMVVLLFVAVGMISFRGIGVVDFGNYLMFDWRYFLLPYGAMLFSLDGGGALPMVVRMLGSDKKAVKSVVRISTFIPVIISFVFVLVIVGISGEATSSDALSGVRSVLNDGVIFFSLLFGVLAMVTSFLGVAQSMRETLMWDFGIEKKMAWAIAVFVPYILYVLGIKNLVDVVGFVGAIGGGLCGIVLVLMMRKVQKKKSNLNVFDKKISFFVSCFLICLFVLGIIYEIYFNIFV